MRYTYKKISGILCMALATMVISRVVPDWLFYTMIGVVALSIIYLLYNYSRY